jgi:hypothetical protein
MTARRERRRTQQSAHARRRAGRECRMPDCRAITHMPLGYCERCWDTAREAEQQK